LDKLRAREQSFTKATKWLYYLQNSEKVKFTKGGEPWRLVWYAAFLMKKEAKNFELYLKTGSGKSFAYKRLISVALKKDFLSGRKIAFLAIFC